MRATIFAKAAARRGSASPTYVDDPTGPQFMLAPILHIRKPLAGMEPHFSRSETKLLSKAACEKLGT